MIPQKVWTLASG